MIDFLAADIIRSVREKDVLVCPVSGGKDSQVLAAWCVDTFPKSRLRFVHQNTGYDHRLTYRHLRYMHRRYGIKIEHTFNKRYPKGMFQFLRTAGYFPNRLARGCTSRLKQQPFAQWLRDNDMLAPNRCHIFMGMRAEESRERNLKYGEMDDTQVIYLSEISDEYSALDLRHVTVSLPIVTWTLDDVFGYLKQRGDKLNELYKRGHKRVGCYPCLLAGNVEWELAARDPQGRAHIKELIQIEDQFKRDKNPRKLVKIHDKRDVRALLREGKKLNPEADETCGWCSI